MTINTLMQFRSQYSHIFPYTNEQPQNGRRRDDAGENQNGRTCPEKRPASPSPRYPRPRPLRRPSHPIFLIICTFTQQLILRTNPAPGGGPFRAAGSFINGVRDEGVQFFAFLHFLPSAEGYADMSS